jgi:hypothetical protein
MWQVTLTVDLAGHLIVNATHLLDDSDTVKLCEFVTAHKGCSPALHDKATALLDMIEKRAERRSHARSNPDKEPAP